MEKAKIVIKTKMICFSRSTKKMKKAKKVETNSVRVKGSKQLLIPLNNGKKSTNIQMTFQMRNFLSPTISVTSVDMTSPTRSEIKPLVDLATLLVSSRLSSLD